MEYFNGSSILEDCIVYQNCSGNSSDVFRGFVPRHGMWHIYMTSVILGLIILITIIGNVFVVAAIILEKNLQSVSNYLILSLAVADLMVATLVMPLSALHEVSSRWWLGARLCDLWICFDVLCCTASILHLVAIAMDRFWAVTNIDYIRVRTARRIISMIVIVWTSSAIISIPARFYIGMTGTSGGPRDPCHINLSPMYTIFSTVVAFYMPMLFMFVIYYKIYITARSRIRRKNFQKGHIKMKKVETEKLLNSPHKSEVPGTSSAEGNNVATPINKAAQVDKSIAQNNSTSHIDAAPITRVPLTTATEIDATDTPVSTCVREKKKRLKKANSGGQANGRTTAHRTASEVTNRERLEHKRERKAARTLAIITGCFLACWLPFFINALFAPFLRYHLAQPVESFFLWLGYLNSTLNPIIYTIFSPDFRCAFAKILYGRYHKPQRRR